MYDSAFDTRSHIDSVRENISEVIRQLYIRAIQHDESKLWEPEKSAYDKYIPDIREVEKKFGYGSPEYELVIKAMSDALQRHFTANRHHPEHFENGINGMTLIDLIEMLADWKSASVKSGQSLNIEANKRRFGISDQLAEILANTSRELGW